MQDYSQGSEMFQPAHPQSDSDLEEGIYRQPAGSMNHITPVPQPQTMDDVVSGHRRLPSGLLAQLADNSGWTPPDTSHDSSLEV